MVTQPLAVWSSRIINRFNLLSVPYHKEIFWMEESESNDVVSGSLYRAGAMRSSARLLSAFVLGLGTIASTFLFSDHENRGNHLRITNDFQRSLERTLQGDMPICELDCCMQYESDICPSDNEWITAIPFAVQIMLIIILICMSALFSGLTLGLMSLDVTGLEIVMSGDDEQAAGYAKAIFPVRKDGNLLLCTLLLGNVAVNALLSILLAEYAGGIVGFITSTFLIVIFGEIVPQALCSRYALRIGSFTVPIVKVIRFILYPVAGPLGKILDFSLGRELATTYSNAEMMKLLQIHVQENVIDQETAGAMQGALTYKNITVKEVMTPIERTFMLSVDDKLSFETIAKIFKTGYSRIPVYEVSVNNVIGQLFVKDLIFIDPEDEVSIRSFVQIFGRGVHVVWPDDTLGDVLAELKKGRSHLALVRDVNNVDEAQDPFYEVLGIITLEDIIEKILGDTIVDETDAFSDGQQMIKVKRAESFEWARLRLLDSKIVDGSLSPSEVQAVTAHLRMNFSESVKLLTDTQLSRLVSTTTVSTLSTANQKLGEALPEELLYEKGVPSDLFTLILSGKVTVLVGEENFRSDLSPWSVLGKAAFENPTFVPDYSAFVSDGPCRCLRFTHTAFVEALDASALERRVSEMKVSHTPPSSIAEDNLSSAAESQNGTSAEPPNRREKLIARLFKKENPERSESQLEASITEQTSSVRFKEGGVFESSRESTLSQALNEGENGTSNSASSDDTVVI